MSKSLGNSIEPQDVIKQSGADVLRLWVAMSDYSQEIRISKEILARAAEAYRKLRNTLRYLLANLYDFNPATDQVGPAEMEEVDRYILARYAELARKVVQAYDEYQYPTVFQALNGFATVDLSAFYADVSKDRLYTFAARSRERRSAQTAMFLMADGLTRLLAPILPVTTDELWQYLPGTREESVHMAVYPATADLERLLDTPLLERWSDRLALRERVLAEIEPLRKSKQIGSSLQAKVILTASGARYEALARDLADLPMLFIVSEVELKKADAAPAEPSADPVIAIARAGGVKCERCWRYVPRVSDAPGSEGLCERCQEALAETVEP